MYIMISGAASASVQLPLCDPRVYGHMLACMFAYANNYIGKLAICLPELVG